MILHRGVKILVISYYKLLHTNHTIILSTNDLSLKNKNISSYILYAKNRMCYGRFKFFSAQNNRAGLFVIRVLESPVPQWRNRLAHGTYMTVRLSNAGVVSSSLTWGIPFSCFIGLTKL